MATDVDVQSSRGFVAVLRNRPFLRIWSSQAISQTAQNIINLALLVTVNGISQSATAVSGIIVAFALPGVVFSTIAGVVVDRSNKRIVMVSVHLLRAIAVVGFTLAADLPVAFALVGIYVLGFVFASVGQFFGPAEGAAIPFLVRRHDLAQANALFTLTVTVSQLVGFATLGPLLVGLLGLDRLYLFVALLFLFCATLIWTLPSMQAAPRVRVDGRGPMEVLWFDVREAWVYIYRDRLLRKAMGFLTFASAAFLALGTLAPKFATTVLQLSQSGLGYILAPAGIGMVIGVVLVGHFATPENRERMIHGGALSQGIMLLLFAVVPNVGYRLVGRPASGPAWPVVFGVMACALLLGVGQAFIVVPSQTLLQERSGEEVRARVLSTFFTLSNASALVPTLTAGLIGDTVGIEAGILTLAIGALALGIWSTTMGGQAGRRARGRKEE
ncbi:MAG: MFS transporter [Thermomicrobia bacterium]|nr:MFS transporter [Thermomicrobia bacterium]